MTLLARFHCAGGSIIDRAAGKQSVTLADAYALVGIWSRKALAYEAEGRHRLARLCAADAQALCVAISQASEWRRASGWRNPHDADRRAS